MPNIHGASVPHSDLWHGDETRDWAGNDNGCCTDPRPEQVEQWRERADQERAERIHLRQAQDRP